MGDVYFGDGDVFNWNDYCFYCFEFWFFFNWLGDLINWGRGFDVVKLDCYVIDFFVGKVGCCYGGGGGCYGVSFCCWFNYVWFDC